MGSFAATGGDTTDVVSRLRGYMRNVEAFNALFPQEKVYLHLDNTGYFAGETIWFKAYVVRADKTVATDISRVLYVELVHSSGEVLKSCKVRIENGQASGCLKLDDAFLLSGFYEIRAYTRYMANWDYRGVFSRVIPVFREPEKRGDYSQKKIDLFSYKLRLPNYREQDSTFEEGIGIKFYPEGGKAVRGLPCRMAFRVSEADGTPVDTVVYLMDGEGKVEDTLATVREGVMKKEKAKTPGKGVVVQVDAILSLLEVKAAESNDGLIRNEMQQNASALFVPIPSYGQDGACVQSKQNARASLSVRIVQQQVGIFVTNFAGQLATESDLRIVPAVYHAALQAQTGGILMGGKEEGIQLQGVDAQSVQGSPSVQPPLGGRIEVQFEVVVRDALPSQEVGCRIFVSSFQAHPHVGHQFSQGGVVQLFLFYLPHQFLYKMVSLRHQAL